MGVIVLGTPRWRELEKWENVCEKHNVKFTLEMKKSKIGYERMWYSLTMNVPNEIERTFMKDIRTDWKPFNQRHPGL